LTDISEEVIMEAPLGLLSISTRLSGASSQKTVIFILVAVRTSDLTV
jgi:hypothetical protein